MKSDLYKLLHLFDTRSKVIIGCLLVMILVGTVLDLFGIGAILPMVTLLSSSEPLEEGSSNVLV